MPRIDSAGGRALKRGIDLAGATIGLMLLAPVFAVIALAIVLDSRGSVFFRQERVGQGGRPFRIWKFRTMAPGGTGPGITVGGDRRVTRVGRVLRAHKLDELPQLLNVLAGEMSLVGPRPEIPMYVALYDERERRVLEVPPGITDPASLRYRDEEAVLASQPDPLAYYRDVLMREKIEINLEYRANATIRTDLALIGRTIAAVLPGTRQRRGVMRLPTAVLILFLLNAPLLAQNAPLTTAEPTLRPGDALRVLVWDHEELSGDFQVTRGGYIVHPVFRELQVAGLPLREIEKRMYEALGEFDTRPRFVIQPLLRVVVGGEVRQPNLYLLDPEMTVAQAVGLAGGVTEFAALDRVALSRGGERIVMDLTRPNEGPGQLPIQSGDQLFVPRRVNVWRDYVLPAGSITGALASILTLILR